MAIRILFFAQSAMLGMAVRANALVLGPIDIRRMEKGMKVKFRWLK